MIKISNDNQMKRGGELQMNLDSSQIADRFNSAIPNHWIGFSVETVCQLCGIAQPTWRKYHKLLRDADTTLIANKKKPFGFTYRLRAKGIDRVSLLLIYSYSQIQQFFHNEKLSIQILYQNWEDIKNATFNSK
jgi:hypothetical protein